MNVQNEQTDPERLIRANCGGQTSGPLLSILSTIGKTPIVHLAR